MCHHHASSIRTDPYLVFGLRLESQFTDYKYMFQQMRLILYLYFYVSSHPTCFGPLLAHHQGCPELLLCYHLALAVLLAVRASVEGHLHGGTDS
jgi:hypothetical protein